MKKFKLLAAASLALLLSLGWTPILMAQSGESDQTEQTEQTTKPSVEEIKARVEERKAKHKLALGEAQKKILALKCKRAQGLINGLSQKASALQTNRARVYDDITDRLTKLIEKLQAKGADTTELEENLAEYKTKVGAFKTNLAAYKLALEDMKDMDCIEDPEGFKASLEEARDIRDAMKEDAKAIRQYVVTVIKETLKEIRAALAEGATSTERTGEQ
jgi:hypothetical protein